MQRYPDRFQLPPDAEFDQRMVMPWDAPRVSPRIHSKRPPRVLAAASSQWPPVQPAPRRPYTLTLGKGPRDTV